MAYAGMTQDRRWGERVLLAVTAVWGTTFLVMADALTVWPAFWVMTLRFGMAAGVLLPVACCHTMTRMVVRDGTVVGIWAFLGFALQTVSLQYTTAAHCAFGTSLVTVLVPPLSVMLGYRDTPWRPSTTLGLLAAGCGALLLMGRALEPNMRWGDLLAVLSALAFAWQVVLLGIYARRCPLLPLVGIEVSVVALCSAGAVWWQHAAPPAQGADWPLLVYLGVVATALCMAGQVWGQARTSPTRAAFVYALEPIFAAALAWGLRQQSMTLVEVLGAALIAFAAVTADLPTPHWFGPVRQ